MHHRGAEGASDGELEVVLPWKMRMNCPSGPRTTEEQDLSELKPSRTCKFSKPPQPCVPGVCLCAGGHTLSSPVSRGSDNSPRPP